MVFSAMLVLCPPPPKSQKRLKHHKLAHRAVLDADKSTPWLVLGVPQHLKQRLKSVVVAVLAGVYIGHAVAHYADSAFGTTLVPLLNSWLNNASVSYNALNELLSEVPAIGAQLCLQAEMPCRVQHRWPFQLSRLDVSVGQGDL